MDIPITQSEAWQNLQNDLGETSFLKTEKDFHYLAILKITPVGNYLYLPYGPAYEDKNGFTKALKSLQELALEKNAIFIRVEPQDPNFAKYAPQSARKTKDINPKETWSLDLTGNEDILKSKLPNRLLRYYKSAAKKGITIETSKDPANIRHLLNLQKALASKKGINTFSENYLKTELKQPFATLYLVKWQDDPQHRRVTALEGGPKNVLQSKNFGGEKEPAGPAESTAVSNKIIAAGLVFDDATTRYNLQGAQSDLGRKLHATGILTIALILDAHKKGLKTFDFWGIAPDGAPQDHPWAGFTAFKKTFAGTEVRYAGDYDIVLKPIKYKIYQFTRCLNRLLRK